MLSGFVEANKNTLQHNCRNWTTFFLDYTTHDTVQTSEFIYILDNDPRMQGSFTLQRPHALKPGVYIGGRKDGTKALVGSLHSTDSYFTKKSTSYTTDSKETDHQNTAD